MEGSIHSTGMQRVLGAVGVETRACEITQGLTEEDLSC